MATTFSVNIGKYKNLGIAFRILQNDATPVQRFIRVMRLKRRLIILHNYFGQWYEEGSLPQNVIDNVPNKLKQIIPWNPNQPITLEQCRKAQDRIIKLLKIASYYLHTQAAQCDPESINLSEKLTAYFTKMIRPETVTEEEGLTLAQSQSQMRAISEDSSYDADVDIDFGGTL